VSLSISVSAANESPKDECSCNEFHSVEKKAIERFHIENIANFGYINNIIIDEEIGFPNFNLPDNFHILERKAIEKYPIDYFNISGTCEGKLNNFIDDNNTSIMNNQVHLKYQYLGIITTCVQSMVGPGWQCLKGDYHVWTCGYHADCSIWERIRLYFAYC